MVKLKTTHFVFFLPLTIGVLSLGEAARQAARSGHQIRQENSEFALRIRKSRDEAMRAQKLSKVALDRAKNNCILVWDATHKREGYLQVGQVVIDSQLSRPLRPGASVCNTLGDTALISNQGAITDIARVSRADKPQFDSLLNQR